jgi:hypothetical protein
VNGRDVPRKKPALVHEVAPSDETVVYDEVGRQLIALNATGAAVWYLIDGARSVDNIVGVIVESVPAECAMVARDVSSFLSELDARGLLDWMRAPSEAPA